VKRILTAPIRLFVILVVLQTGSCSKNDLSNEPRITNVTPSSGGAGRRIIIESNDAFSGDAADQTVKFSASRAQVISVTKSSNDRFVFLTMLALDGSGLHRAATRSKVPYSITSLLSATEYFVRFKENGVFVEGISLLDTAPRRIVLSPMPDRVTRSYFCSGHAKEAYIEIHLDHNNTIELLDALYGIPIAIRPRNNATIRYIRPQPLRRQSYLR